MNSLLCAATVLITTAALAGCFLLSSHSIVDELDHPISIQTCTEAGLLTSSGDILKVPETESLTCDSEAMREVMSHHIEVDHNGRVHGLVRVHHWCGNDPVSFHLARVDVGRMIAFLETSASVYGAPRFSEHGWNASQYYEFKDWDPWVDEGRRRLGGRQHE